MRNGILVVAVLALSAVPAAAEPNQQLYNNLPALPAPPVPDGVLAFGTSFEMVSASLDIASAGQANNGVDDESTTLGLSLGTRYFRGYEADRFGYSVLANGNESLSRVPSGDGSLITNILSVDAQPELRYYPMPNSPLFIHGTVDFSTTLTSVKNTDTDTSDSNGPGQVGVAFGVGAGRVLAIDPVVRVRRLEQALRSEGILKGGISPQVGTQIIRSWYALRNDFTDYRRLGYAMKHLYQAGLLTEEPNLRATYKARAVVADPFIVNRRRGWEARGGIGIVQPFVAYDDMDEPDAVFAFLGSGQYELPLDTERQLSVRGKLFFDLGSTDDQSRAWNMRAFATYTQVFYNTFYDPTGALSLSGSAGISGLRLQDGVMNGPDTGLDVSGTLSYSRALNRGSLATASTTGSLFNDGSFSLLISVGITWGVASGFYTPYYSGQLAKL
jgi:hypothetical protein